jgi:phosphoribosyl-dephospho-CoA transferase
MSSMPETFRRHTFVWLSEEASGSIVLESGDPALLRDWIAKMRPLIVRRPCLSPDGNEVFLGVALPGKRRLACRAPRAAVLRTALPPLLGDCDLHFETLVALRAIAPDLRVFGSHAWQHLTGLPYVTESSDIDLLALIDSPEEWERFCTAMSALPLPTTPRLDLEVVLLGDASFSWREFLASETQILLKSSSAVWLESKSRVSALLHD